MEIEKYNEAKKLQIDINLLTDIINWYTTYQGAISNYELSIQFLTKINDYCKKVSDYSVQTQIVVPNINSIKSSISNLIVSKQIEFDNLTCEEEL